MSLKDDMDFRKQLERSPNVYAEVCRVMNAARALADLCDNKILHSEALTHIVRGTEPNCPYIADYRDEYEAYHIRDMFCYIDDKDICDAVYDSFYESKRAKNLVYVYNHINDSGRRARVRVLTRMLWYKLIK